MRSLLLLLTLLLAGCVTQTIPTATPEIIPLPTLLPANSTLDLTLPPNGTPEVAPQMIFKVRIYDDVSGEKIEGNVFWSDVPIWMGVSGDDLVGLGIHGIDMVLGGEAHGWLTVAADGYEMWRLEIKYRTETSRYLDMPVRLRRVGGGDSL